MRHDTQVQCWQPVLTGEAAQQAIAIARNIARSLPSPPALPERSHGPDGTARPAADLAKGVAGQALLHAYMARALPESDGEEAALRCLEHALATVSAAPMSVSLYGGFTGVAWTLAHLEKQLVDPDAGDLNESVDAVLLERLRQSPWPGQYDLISGLVGIGVYALERLPRATGAVMLTRVIHRLAELAETTPEGITWITSPDRLSLSTRTKCPQGYYNLGMAHGLPGVIALLGRACAAGVAAAEARPLLDGAVGWLLARHRSEGEYSFPGMIEPGKPPTPTRAAWCYGDPGVVAALLGAARAAGEGAWEQTAVTVARQVASRPPGVFQIRDAGLCHGAAGLGHLFNRLFQATGDGALRDAARYWLHRTLAMYEPDRGIGGYAAWIPGPDGEVGWQPEPGLLYGAAGVALALLAASTPVAPDWDRLMLLDLAPASAAALQGQGKR